MSVGSRQLRREGMSICSSTFLLSSSRMDSASSLCSIIPQTPFAWPLLFAPAWVAFSASSVFRTQDSRMSRHILGSAVRIVLEGHVTALLT